MQLEGHKSSREGESKTPAAGRQYGWKERTYVVPSPSRTGFQWKASALHGLQRLDRRGAANCPVTVVVPALYNIMPAEVLALGWLNEIDALAFIRQRIMQVARTLGWDAFTFHTRHSLDPYFDSTINAVRETWLNEGALSQESIVQTRKRFGAAHDYHRIEPRLVENLLIQSSLMDWLTVRAAGKSLQFHVIGTGLLSALVWSGASTFQNAMQAAVAVGASWDARLEQLAQDEIRQTRLTQTEENLGWLRFHRVRQIIEGRAELSLKPQLPELPGLDDPVRPFWYSQTGKADPVRIETRRDIQAALETMDLKSWAPQVPKPLMQDRQTSGRVRGWLASPMHPIASTCRWSFYNYLLATPASSLLFLNHIASAVVSLPIPTPSRRNVFEGGSTTYPSARPSETRSAPVH